MKKHNNSLIKIRNSGLNHEFCYMQLLTAGLLIIENRKLLLAFSKNKQCFYLPGGKIDAGETAESALCREIGEELNIRLVGTDLTYYTHISAPAYGEEKGIMLEQDCPGQRTFETCSGSRDRQIPLFHTRRVPAPKNVAPGAVLVLEQLKADNLID